MSSKKVDCYCDGEFLGSWEYESVFVKLLEKGAQVEVAGGDLWAVF